MAMRLATVRIGAVQVGVAAGAVLQALPSAGLSPLPRRRGALCGVVEHAGRLVPVVDLARWVEVGQAPQGDEAAARVLLLRDGERRFGLRVDAVGGLAEADEAGVSRLLHDEDPEEVFHTAVKARGSGTVLSVLDTGRLAALAAAWQEDGEGAAAVQPAAAEPDQDSGARRVAAGLLQAGAMRIALPVADLAEVLPLPTLSSAGFGMAHCLWRGRTVPVLPAGALGEDAAGDGALLAVFEREGQALGLRVDAALGMQEIDARGDAPAAAGGLAAACHDGDGHAVLLLDMAKLFARFPEAALARRPGSDAGARGAQDGGRLNESAWVVFEAGGTLATPIEVLEEILPLPPALGATLAWRGKTLAVTDLRPAGTEARGQLMVLRRGAQHAACVVAHVSLLVPPRGARIYRLGAGEFITVGEGAGQASYRAVDLAAQAGLPHAA